MSTLLRYYYFLVIAFLIFLINIPNVFAGGTDTVENLYFSVNIPDSWTYIEDSYKPQILLAPDEFSDVLLSAVDNIYRASEGGVVAAIEKSAEYPLKSAPLESYVKYVIDKLGIQNITSQHYTTVGKEKAVRIDANQSTQYGDRKFSLYLVMHDKEPYNILFLGNPINEKYLPEFEQIVKTFRFVGNQNGTQNLSENESVTNIPTNFSDANLDRGYLGIVGVALAPELSEQIGLNQTKGFLVTSITEGSPAEKYGLKAGSNPKMFNGREINTGGDIILKIDNKEVTKIDDIMKHNSEKRAGDKVHLTFLRDNAIKELDVILEAAPSQLQPPQNGDSNYPEELYDECVNVAGKSFCDFLFKR